MTLRLLSWYSTVIFCRLEHESPPLLQSGSISMPAGTQEPNKHPICHCAGLLIHSALSPTSSHTDELPY